jgi:hypothetical protein
MARTTDHIHRDAAPVGRRRTRRWDRLVAASVLLAVLGTAAARAAAAPVGPIDAAGAPAPGPVAAARLTYGIDGQGRLDRVTVHREGTVADEAVTIELSGDARTLAAVPAVLHGPVSVVVLPAPVDPALVTAASVRSDDAET